MVVEVPEELGAYYGIQGMKWPDAPILSGPHQDIELDGRRLSVYSEGGKVRLVAWRTKQAVYYVHNSLGRDLTRDQMIRIAASLDHL